MRTRWATAERSRGWCSTPTLRRNAFALAALLLALGATLVRPPATAGPVARDFEAYYAAGATWNAGGDPYSRDIWSVERTIPGVDATRDELLPFVGPAASLPLWSLLARLPFATAGAVWLGVLGLALAVLALAAATFAAGRLSLPHAALALLLGALSGPVIGDIALGQAALAAAAAYAIALLALERASLWAIPAAVCAAIQPNLALPLALRAGGRRTALLGGAAITFIALTLVAGGGPRGALDYLQHLAEHGASERASLIQYSIPAIATAFGLAAPFATAAGIIALLIAGSVALLSAFALRAHPREAAVIAIAVLPFALPFFHEHDFVIELIPAIVLAAAPDARARRLGGAGVTCTLVDWLGVAQRPHAALQTACLALALTCAYVALAGGAALGESRLWRIPAAGALFALLLVPLALHAPAPVWPDSLGGFHAAATLDASAVWAAEQQAAGLNATAPAWGLLRAVPLVGCALLAAGGVLAARTAQTTR